ncbi:MAG: efflux RND transporter periplasmic adaptor subunit [Bacillota bacterium]
MNREFLHNAGAVSKVFLARLRFLAVFLAAGFIVGYWDNIKNHWDKWTRPRVAPDSLVASAASNIEYYCAMHPNIVRNEPGNCPICSMPLIKRKKGEQVKLPEDVLARVQLSPQRIALANIQTSVVEPRALVHDIHAVGVLDYNETKVAQISARVAGRADELFLQYTGQDIKKGEPLYSLYSPELYTAQREYLLARKRANELPAAAAQDARTDAASVYNASMQKLVLWGITREQLDSMDKEYDQSGKIPSHLIVASPVSGIVVKKDLFEGGYVNVGDRPYTIADLDTLWLQAKIYERDVPLVQIGQPVQVTVEALPNETFTGTVAFRAFQIDPQTRTLDARIVVSNPRNAKGELRLRPGMFADAAIRVPVLPSESSTTKPVAVSAAMTLACAEAFQSALKPYLQAQTLLSQDKADGVSDLLHQSLTALENLCESERGNDAYKRLVEAIHKTRGQGLAALRETFKAVSTNLIEIGKATGLPPTAAAVQVFRCPMAKATWLQTATETANPYYGSSMLTCGGPVEVLPKADALAAAAKNLSALPATKVLAIPRSSVIDTGRNKVVYVESAPGVFDMHTVKLGAAAGEYYPVLEGLNQGDRVVTVGAFLVDAENRLNPAQTAEAAPAAASDGESKHQH